MKSLTSGGKVVSSEHWAVFKAESPRSKIHFTPQLRSRQGEPLRPVCDPLRARVPAPRQTCGRALSRDRAPSWGVAPPRGPSRGNHSKPDSFDLRPHQGLHPTEPQRGSSGGLLLQGFLQGDASNLHQIPAAVCGRWGRPKVFIPSDSFFFPPHFVAMGPETKCEISVALLQKLYLLSSSQLPDSE